MKRAVVYFVLFSIGTFVFADIPEAIPHQGRIVSNGNNFDGSGQFKFLLFGDEDADHSSGNELAVWSNTATTPANMNEPSAAVSLFVTKGLYSVWLGDTDTTGMAALPADFDPSDKQLYLRLWFDDGSSGMQQLSPDQKIASVPYALLAAKAEFATGAGTAQSVPAGSIGSMQIQDGAIQSIDIADASIVSADIMPGAISQLGTPDGSTADALQVTNAGTAGLGTMVPLAGLHVSSSSSVLSPNVLSVIRDDTGLFVNLNNPQGTAINSNRLLAVASADNNAVTIIDCSTLESPTLVSNLRSQGGNPLSSVQSVVFCGDTLLAVAAPGASAVTLFQVSSIPGSGTTTAVIEDGITFQDLDAPSGLAYDASLNILAISSPANNAVTIVNLAVPATPVQLAVLKDGVGGFNALEGAHSLAFNPAGLLAIAAEGENAVTLVDLSTPGSPILRAEIRDAMGGFDELLEPAALAFGGPGLLAIGATGDNAVSLVDIASPAAPSLLAVMQDGVGVFEEIARPSHLAFQGSARLIVSGEDDDAVTVVDVSTPGAPSLVQVIRDDIGSTTEIGGPGALAFATPDVLVVAGTTDDAITLLDLSTTAESGLLVEERIGVGVAAPQAALHVAGDLQVEGASIVGIRSEEVKFETHRFSSGKGAQARGLNSIALGLNARAIREEALALGARATAVDPNTVAIGSDAGAGFEGAVAVGNSVTASAIRSVALGQFTLALGDEAVAIGFNTIAPSFGETAIGRHNTSYTPQSTTAWDPNDRLFVIGNGQSFGASSDQLIIYKDGRLEHDGSIDVSGSATIQGMLNVTGDATMQASLETDSLLVNSDATMGSVTAGVVQAGTLNVNNNIATLKNVIAAGAVTAGTDVTGDSHKFPSAQTFARNISGNSLVPRDGQSFFRSELGFIRQNAVGINLYANVQLPQGATVTAAKLLYYDNSSAGSFTNLRIRFRRRALASTGTENIGAIDQGSPPTSASTTVRTQATSITASRAVVDNQAFHYFMHVDATTNNAADPDLRIYGFEILYTLTSLKP